MVNSALSLHDKFAPIGLNTMIHMLQLIRFSRTKPASKIRVEVALWRHMLCPCLTVHLPPPERSGGKERKGGDKQASDEGTRANLVCLDPSEPRCRDGEQEHGGDRAEHQCAEVHAEPEPASWGVLCGMVAQSSARLR